MESDYDKKFQEMKKYIPFLEDMIKRLEDTGTGPSNPRQAQLSKIKALKDLLLNKNKRMKMENLLKCEHVLVNLYNKVEQKDSIKPALAVAPSAPPTSSQSSFEQKLDSVRQKLKVVTQRDDHDYNTLPEIARAQPNETLYNHGSKEPALFHRRPNRSPVRSPKKSPKRNYTRVLVSPEPSPHKWKSPDSKGDKSLYNRRSPRRSPKRSPRSPKRSPHKKDKKKNRSDGDKSQKSPRKKDFNITLKVPEDSLSSLNTENIFDRIINCDDNDVDITTLRELRSQIIGELQQTGARDDISDLIMKSYNKKKKKEKRQKEVEDGELSDSESEAIKNVYGSLSLVVNSETDTKKQESESKKFTSINDNSPQESRKIQISLVVANANSVSASNKSAEQILDNDELVLDVNSPKVNSKCIIEANNFDIESKPEDPSNIFDLDDKKTNVITEPPMQSVQNNIEISNKGDCVRNSKNGTEIESDVKVTNKANFYKPIDGSEFDISSDISKASNKVHKTSPEEILIKDENADTSTITTIDSSDFDIVSKKTKPNKQAEPLIQNDSQMKTTETKDEVLGGPSCSQKKESPRNGDPGLNKNVILLTNKQTLADSPTKNTLKMPSSNFTSISENISELIKKSIKPPAKDTPAVTSDAEPKNASDESHKIPFIDDQEDNKNNNPEKKDESVSEIDILKALKNDILSESLSIPVAVKSTPALHQPKVTKVTNVQEIAKKKISFNEYKETKGLPKPKIFPLDPGMKQSRGLTEKECERFNLPCRLSLDNSSDEDVDLVDNTLDIYSDLAPKSPDSDPTPSEVPAVAPVIIPADPVKPPTPPRADIDMRKVSSNTNEVLLPLTDKQSKKIDPSIQKRNVANTSVTRSLDPRVRNNRNPYKSPQVNPGGISRPLLGDYPNMTPSMTPNARSFQMTPSHQTFDYEHSSQKHVYAPSMTYEFEDRERKEQYHVDRYERARPNEAVHHHPHSRWGNQGTSVREEYSDAHKNRFVHSMRGNPKHNYKRRGEYSPGDCASTPSHHFGRAERPATPSHPFGRGECPTTPSHPFGRECPTTPSHPFGRAECPTTPSHPFGRTEHPITPSHPFGRGEHPTTPIHPFGRVEHPTTPSHPFGRTEHPTTPSHPFGRKEHPPTPSHPFGRTELPTTPGHPFGRTEHPSTPSHPFGRAEHPTTPSHSFGRGDRPKTPVHSFGRSDYKQNAKPIRADSSVKSGRDPRQIRSHDNNKDISYPDKKSHAPHSYGPSAGTMENTDSYTRHSQEQSVGRNLRDNERHSFRRESSVGRYLPHREGRPTPLPYNDSRTSQFVSQSYNVVGTRRISNSKSEMYLDDVPRTYREHRAKSVGRYDSKQVNDTHVSVESTCGKGFTIDTSVKASFQDLLSSNEKTESDFSARKKRASSVGRSTRETSVSRSVFEEFTPNFNKRFYTNRPNFQRAQSVGRELVAPAEEKSFKDIQKDFEKYKNESSDKIKAVSNVLLNTHPRARRDDYKAGKESKKKDAYSPRKNPRDPRLRKDNKPSPRNKISNERRDSTDSIEKRHGINYSSDNIASGTVLGAGFGVKNFRIPKIKRPVEELPETEPEPKKQLNEHTKSLNKGKKEFLCTKNEAVLLEKIKKASSKTKEKNKKNSKMTGPKEASPDTSPKVPRRIRKPVIDHSDSDSNDEILSLAKSMLRQKSGPQKNTQTKEKSVTNDPLISEDRDSISNDSFSLIGDDDLNIFNETIAPDSVIDNINELIADLDDDIERSKLGKAPLAEVEKDRRFDSILDSLSEDHDVSVEQNQNDTLKTWEKPHEKVKEDVNICENVANLTGDHEGKLIPAVENIHDDKTLTNENIVSTSELNEAESDPPKSSAKVVCEEQQNPDISSTPDSTIDSGEAPPKLDVETTDMDGQMNSDVTSTHNSSKKSESVKEQDPVASSSNQQAPDPNSDPLTSILSLLQDKAKIKALLNMLDDHQDSEKIKKKLKKLSAIVSDDEEDAEKTLTTENIDEASKALDTSSNSDKTRQIDESKLSTSEHLVEENSPVVETEHDLVEQSMQKDECPATVNVGDDSPSKPSVDGIELDSNTGNQPSNPIAPNNVDNTDSENFIKDNELLDSNETKKLLFTKHVEPKINKPGPKKRRKKGIGKKKVKAKAGIIQNVPSKRVTRASKATVKGQPKRNRELETLQKDIREMFISDDVLNATGLRMCRLAKLVDEDSGEVATKQKKYVEPDDDLPAPKVVLEKLIPENMPSQKESPKTSGKKRGPKPKNKPLEQKETTKKKPGPKSVYQFESDSQSETPKEAENSSSDSSSDSETESLSSLKSFESTEPLSEVKKKKRKRGAWKTGVIRSKRRSAKNVKSYAESAIEKSPNPADDELRTISIPDLNCFTDKGYCFNKKGSDYQCRLCTYQGNTIVHHYKTEHSHYEIPLSRVNPSTAKEAIKQSMVTNFQTISKANVKEYVCCFCFRIFSDTHKDMLEAFFWHIVSQHTGEYKQLCSECKSNKKCPFMLDIPPPPKDLIGLLMGFICGKCNYTQVSLENLKNHVSLRHNDEETEVYTISLSVLKQAQIEQLKAQCIQNMPQLKAQSIQNMPRILRSIVSKHADSKDEETDIKTTATPSAPASKKGARSVQSKLQFESDDQSEYMPEPVESPVVKTENGDSSDGEMDNRDCNDSEPQPGDKAPIEEECGPVVSAAPSSDIYKQSHFKINVLESNREYICSINGNCQYKTTLLISLKKHVQMKHKAEKWDGYCCVCTLMVMPQGVYEFKECLMHMLDKHMEDFPLVNDHTPVPDEVNDAPREQVNAELEVSVRPYLKVRPVSELISTPLQYDSAEQQASEENLPKIESVVSLNTETCEPEIPNVPESLSIEIKEGKYEEIQEVIMKNKHRIVLESMLTEDKLVHIFKCSGKFCSFSCDSAEDAVVHASTHKKYNNEDAMRCSYCAFGKCENAIDLVSHVFKEHGSCRYVCNKCFYRGLVSPLVEMHYIRYHGPLTNGAVLEAPNFTVDIHPSEGVQPIGKIIRPYDCETVFGEPCRFKTFMTGAFVIHSTGTHRNSKHMCDTSDGPLSSSAAIMRHLNDEHGMKMFHCAYCGFGTDTKFENLSHCSSSHPSQIPQAYVRRQLGTQKCQMMALVNMLQSPQVEPKSVPITATNENPIREAERSVNLEKLIGHTTQMLLEMNCELEQPDAIQSQVTEVITDDVPLSQDSLVKAIDDTETAAAKQAIVAPVPQAEAISRAVTPVLATNPDSENFLTPMATVTKSEFIDKTDQTHVSEVINLDSDDEVAPSEPPSVIDLSDEEPTPQPPPVATTPQPTPVATSPQPSPVATTPQPTPVATTPPVIETKRYPPATVYKCGRCGLILKNVGGMKRHFLYCYGENDLATCPHCPYQDYNKNNLVEHIKNAHAPVEKYTCGVCRLIETSYARIKDHLAQVHGQTKGIFKRAGKEGFEFIVDFESKSRAGKRKRSTTEAVTPTKQKRYGPEDVSKLPYNQILDESVYCALCEYHTKVRLNMVRHLTAHAAREPVAEVAAVNPVPYLETNEMYFDRMANLASSSVSTRPAAAPAGPRDPPAAIAVHIPLDIAARFPKYVAERKRYACGAKHCDYISIDEAMLQAHWETLHAGSTEYTCVHCPPNQQLDTSKQLTATRIIGHLKMHDVRLYTCSQCFYYHHQQSIVAKHLLEKHKNKGEVRIVREPVANPVPPAGTQQSVSAPTMDLKPWQCGLCSFKSMLRPEVVEHCHKNHNSKFQFKCAFCRWRTSTEENVTKHHATSHKGQQADVFYFYYREGSLPDDPDGTPRWMRQKKKSTTTSDVMKKETNPEPEQKQTSKPLTLDLSVVKTEQPDTSPPVQLQPIEDLCKKYGEACDSNGLLYRCPLCKITMDTDKNAMQSHLYEELKIRKWGCNICLYKAFHKAGMKEHSAQEHKGMKECAVELPSDPNVERWIVHVLGHQEKMIEKNKENMKKAPENVNPKPSIANSPSISTNQPEIKELSGNDLEKIFGSFGAPSNHMFCCPKCTEFKTRDELKMQEHLEMELSNVRWCCSACPDKFQQYHQAQLHCKSVHVGLGARAVEAERGAAARAAWVEAVLNAQREHIRTPNILTQPRTDTDNSLLVVRYEKSVPTPEETGHESEPRKSIDNIVEERRTSADSHSSGKEWWESSICDAIKEDCAKRRSRPGFLGEDSDDEDKLIIDEKNPQKKSSSSSSHSCRYCDFTTQYPTSLEYHTLRHYGLKPYICGHCNFNNYNATVRKHIEVEHSGLPIKILRAAIPRRPPSMLDLNEKGRPPSMLDLNEKGRLTKATPIITPKPVIKEPKTKPEKEPLTQNQEEVTCLICELSVPESDITKHTHTFCEPQFAKKGDLIYKCCICLVLRINLPSISEHHKIAHPGKELNYAYHKLHLDSREVNICCMDRCGKPFKYIKDLKAHHNRIHGSNVPLNYKIQSFSVDSIKNPEFVDLSEEGESSGIKRKRGSLDSTPTKRVAKKSTTKLPHMTVAKKSTTKLPFHVRSDPESDEEYTYYGKKPLPLNSYSNVTTNMPFMNTVVPFTLEKLTEIVNISPKVLVEDVTKK